MFGSVFWVRFRFSLALTALVGIVVLVSFNELAIRPGELPFQIFETQLESSEVQSSRFQVANIDLALQERVLTVDSKLTSYTHTFAESVAFDKFLLDLDFQQAQILLAESENIESLYKRTSIQSQIVRRLATEHPQRAIEYVKDFSRSQYLRFLDLIFREWCVFNLKEATTFAQTLSHFERRSAINAIVQVRDELQEDVIIDIGYQLGQLFFSRDLLAQVHRSVFDKDPEAIWFAMVGDHWEYIDRKEDLYRVATEWVARDGISVLLDIAESLPDSQIRDGVLRYVLGQHAYSNPREAFDKAIELINLSDWRIVQVVVVSWARFAPEEVLNTLDSLESEDLRNRLLDTVINVWAHTDAWETLQNLALLPDELQSEARKKAIRLLALRSPTEAAKLLANLPENEQDNNLVREFVRNWSSLDIGGALDWALTTTRFNEMQQELLQDVLGNLTPENTELIITSIFNHPTVEDSISVKAILISKLALLDVDKAIALLPQVDHEQTRLISYSVVGVALIESNEFARATEIASSLPTHQRADYFDAIFEHWTELNPTEARANIDHLPTTEAKSRAALWLLTRPTSVTNLTLSQIEHLKSVLTSEDSDVFQNGTLRSNLDPNYR